MHFPLSFLFDSYISRHLKHLNMTAQRPWDPQVHTVKGEYSWTNKQRTSFPVQFCMKFQIFPAIYPEPCWSEVVKFLSPSNQYQQKLPKIWIFLFMAQSNLSPGEVVENIFWWKIFPIHVFSNEEAVAGIIWLQFSPTLQSLSDKTFFLLLPIKP